MRKIATSLATLAALFYVSAASGRQNPHDLASAGAGERQNFDQRETFLGASNIPTLGHHLESADALGVSLRDDQLGNHTVHDSADCNLARTLHHKAQTCGCEHDDWGCEGGRVHVPHAGMTSLQGVENSLTATIIPAQVLVSNSTTVTQGEQCEASRARRNKTESEIFAVEGNFRRSKFDAQEQCKSEASCFQNNGIGRAAWKEGEGEHDIDACDCNLISTGDLLDLEEDCDCLQQNGDHNGFHVDISDPEADVERRINEEIERTIADILSEIVQNAFHQSFEHVIEFN